tara:strand:+ start:130 stop:315 length:186 start_codon:yes stop_codon:yes gene_type:complete
MGGERQTLGGFVQRCDYLKTHEDKMLKRVLNIGRPGQDALERVRVEVWKSQVSIFRLEEEK